MPDVVTGLVAGGATVLGSSSQSSAAESASDAQVQAAQIAADEQRRSQEQSLEFLETQLGIGRDLLAPYVQPSAMTRSDLPEYITEDNAQSIFDRNPQFRSEYQRVVSEEGDTRTPEQWLEDHLSRTDSDLVAQERQDVFEQSRIGDPYQQQLALAGVLGPEAEKRATQGLMDSPTAQFLQSEGMRSIDASASATGGLGGSARLRQLSEFNQNLANTLVQDRFNQLGALTGVQYGATLNSANMGNQAGSQMAGVAQATGNNLSNIALGSGQAQAQNQLAQGNIQSNLFSDLAGGAIGYGLYNNGSYNSNQALPASQPLGIWS